MAVKNKKQNKRYDRKVFNKKDYDLQEMVALARRIDTMEKQIFQLAEKVGVQLKA